MQSIDPIDKSVGILLQMKIVRVEHFLEFTKFTLMNRLNQILLVLCIVEEAATLARTAKLYKALIVVKPY
jgi:hypothetical protein